MALRIAICCFSHIFGEGLKKLIEDDDDIHVVGIFSGNGSVSDIENMLKLNPDILVTDFNANFNLVLNLPSDILAANKLKILMIGDRNMGFFADKDMKDLIARGIVGILPPSADSDLLKKAIKSVSTGELWLDRSTLMKLFSSIKEQGKSLSLAKREREIVFHICQGYRNREIAQKLNISEQTVKSHCNRIYKKLGVSDRLQLALQSYKIWPFSSKVSK
jgi:DNA-binding NarL/FixJ family response regulator